MVATKAAKGKTVNLSDFKMPVIEKDVPVQGRSYSTVHGDNTVWMKLIQKMKVGESIACESKAIRDKASAASFALRKENRFENRVFITRCTEKHDDVNKRKFRLWRIK